MTTVYLGTTADPAGSNTSTSLLTALGGLRPPRRLPQLPALGNHLAAPTHRDDERDARANQPDPLRDATLTPCTDATDVVLTEPAHPWAAGIRLATGLL